MKSAGKGLLSRRQGVLFLAAISIPCIVLTVLGLQMMKQERQLENRRVADEGQDRILRTSQQLLTHLETTKLQLTTRAAASGGNISLDTTDGEAVFVGRVENGQLLLSWENSADARIFGEAIRRGEFAAKFREAEHQELVAKQNGQAADQYRAALASATQGAQLSYARLALARTLEKAGQHGESVAEFTRLAETSPGIVDELGVPLGLYALPPLVDNESSRQAILKWIQFGYEQGQAWPTVALNMTRDLAVKSILPDSAARLNDLIQIHEQAEALQQDWSRLMPAFQSLRPVWITYGRQPWLVGLTPAVGGTEGLVVAVPEREALDRFRLSRTLGPSGQSLGESFPDLHVVLPDAAAPQPGSGQFFLITALVVALVFTMLAGYLLWRDVRRGLRMAEMRSQFVSSVSHELKTPLTAIRMFTETLRLDEEVDRGTRNEYLDTILHESERLSRLVDNVLDFGKIERGKKTYRFQPVRLQEVIDQAARTAQYPFEQAGFLLEVFSEADVPPISADSDALQQAILNLLTNAMKYSGDSRRVGLSLARQNGHARIRVEDHGVGIAPEEQARIFDRFYRVPSTENAHIPGTGLGLTIVDHIVKAHGGIIEVLSKPREGSSFTISLPVANSV